MSRRGPIYRLGAARAISVTGSQVALIALTFQIYERTESAVWVSAVFLATFAALGILTPIGGWLGDRFDRRTVMIVSDLAAAGVFAGLALVHSPWAMVGLALLATAAEAPFLPASQAAIPNLADDADLAWANGLVTQAFSVGITAGPLIGGVLVGAVGTSAAFGINAVSFLVSAALVWSVRVGFQERRSAGAAATPDVPFTAGIGMVLRSRVLRLLVLSEVVAFSVVGWSMVSDAPLARLFEVGSVGFAALISAWGIGMLAGSFVGGRVVTAARQLPIVFGGMLAMGVMVALIGLSPVFAMALVVSALGGGASGMVSVARQTLLQRSVPDDVRARVFAVAEVVATAAFTLGLATAGPAVELVGVREAYVISGLVFSLGALVVIPLLRRPTPAATSSG